MISEVGPTCLASECQALHVLAGAVPGNEDFRGKVLSGASKRTANRAAQALRMAAAALRSSQSALGAYYRRLCARPRSAQGHHRHRPSTLARLIYTMLTKGTEYTDQGQDYYEERYRQRVMHHLAKRAENSAQLTGRDHLEPSSFPIS